jgi:hypothetical protein
MGERTDQIEKHIQRQRDELEDNFSELERKVRDAFDWRTQFQEHPGMMLGAALVGGALIGAILPSRSSVTAKVTSRRRSFSARQVSQPSLSQTDHSLPHAVPAAPAWNAYAEASGEVAQKTSEVWDNLKNAAMGMAAARLGDAIEEVVPGFAEHYKKAAGNNKSRSAKAVWPYSVPKPDDSSSTEASQPKPNGGTDYGSHS